MLAFLLGLGGLSLLATILSPQSLRYFANLSTFFAAALIASLLIMKPEAPPEGGLDSVRVSLINVAFPASRSISLGGTTGDDIVLGDPDGIQPLPADAMRLTAANGRIQLQTQPDLHARLMIVIGQNDSADKVFGATPVATTAACGAFDPRQDCTRRDHLKPWSTTACIAIAPDSGTNRSPLLTLPTLRLYAAPAYTVRKSHDPHCMTAPDKASAYFQMKVREALSGPNNVAAILGWATTTTSQLFAVVPGTMAPIEVPDGARVRIYQLLPPPNPDPKLQPEAGRVETVFDAAVAIADNKLIVTFTKPDVRSFLRDQKPDAAVPAITLATAQSMRRQTLPLANAAVFERLGAPFEADFATIAITPPLADGTPAVVKATSRATMTGNRILVEGEAATTEIDVRRIDVGQGGFGRLGWLALAALIVGWAPSLALRLLSPAAAVMFGMLELLLVVRLIFAVEGAMADPVISVQPYPANAVIALLAAPLALLLAWRADPMRMRSTSRWVVILYAVGIAVAGTAIYLLCDPPPSKEAMVASSGLLLVAGLVFCAQRPHLLPGKVLQAIGHWLGWVLTRAVMMFKALASRFGTVGRIVANSEMTPILLTIAAIFPLRWLFGRESVSILGARVAVSLVLLPLTLYAAARLFAWMFGPNRPALSARAPLLTFVILQGLGIGVASWMVADSGFAIVVWPIAVGAAFMWAMRVPTSDYGRQLATAIGVSLFGIGLLVLYFNALISKDLLVGGGSAVLTIVVLLWAVRRGGALWPASAAGIGILTVVVLAATQIPPQPVTLAQANEINVNTARLLGAFAPQRLALAGTRAAMEFNGVLAVTRDYAESGSPFGAGYLSARQPATLHDTHLTDHAASVHLLSPHGRLGALAVLIVSAAAAALYLRTMPDPSRTGSWFGLLAALTVPLTTAYMIMGNLGTLPFTGRNMYLLAPQSSGDLLEGWMLIAFAAWFFVPPMADE